MTQALEQKLAGKSKTEAGQAAKIAQHVRDAIRQTRSLARGLSPVEFEANGLMSALQELTGNVQEMFRVQCIFRCDQPVLIRENAVATNLFRIAQEAVSNAIKHGQASQIEISLEASAQHILLTVKDNGIGIASDRENGNGMGLRIMSHRAAVSGGRFSVHREPAGGTIAVCTIGNPKAVLLPETT
jgi:signal transduction histidine kinase